MKFIHKVPLLHPSAFSSRSVSSHKKWKYLTILEFEFIYRQCGQAYEMVTSVVTSVGTSVVTSVVTSAYFEPKNQNKFQGFQKRYYATF